MKVNIFTFAQYSSADEHALKGVIFPVGFFMVNDQEPDTQPWRQGANPLPYQDYFDKIYNDIILLKKIPMPMGRSSWNHRIVQGEDKEGLVRDCNPISAFCTRSANIRDIIDNEADSSIARLARGF
jgi:hypothetical protein